MSSTAGTIASNAIAGASMGMAFGPIGAGIGALAGGIGGFFKDKKLQESKAAADKAAAAVPREDPMIQSLMGEARQKKKNLSAMTDRISGMQRRAINASLDKTMSSIASQGANPSLTMDAFLKSQQKANLATTQMGQQAGIREDRYFGAMQRLGTRMADRRFVLDTYKRDELKAQWAAQQSQANADEAGAMTAAMGLAGNLGNMLKGAGTPKTTGEDAQVSTKSDPSGETPMLNTPAPFGQSYFNGLKPSFNLGLKSTVGGGPQQISRFVGMSSLQPSSFLMQPRSLSQYGASTRPAWMGSGSLSLTGQ